MAPVSYCYTHQSEDWHPRGSRRLRRTTIFNCDNTTLNRGGSYNCIDSSVAAGYYSNYGVIGGGFGYTISAGYSMSAILGGCGNNDCGFNYSAVFGCNVCARATNTFHVECVNAIHTPCYTGTPFPSGTIFACCATLPVGAFPLYIMP